MGYSFFEILCESPFGGLVYRYCYSITVYELTKRQLEKNGTKIYRELCRKLPAIND